MEFRQNQAIYLQIADHISERILSGMWTGGERIPSIREMSEEIEVNPNTVMAAYRQLESLGIVENRRGLGMFVTADARRLAAAYHAERLERRLDEWLEMARDAQLGDEVIRQLVEKKLGKLEGK